MGEEFELNADAFAGVREVIPGYEGNRVVSLEDARCGFGGLVSTGSGGRGGSSLAILGAGSSACSWEVLVTYFVHRIVLETYDGDRRLRFGWRFR